MGNDANTNSNAAANQAANNPATGAGNNPGTNNNAGNGNQNTNTEPGGNANSNEKVVQMTQEQLDSIIADRVKRTKNSIYEKLGLDSEKMNALLSDNSATNSQQNSTNASQNEIRNLNEKLDRLTAEQLCYRKNINHEYANDVITLAKSYVNETTNFEQALDQVLQKFPQFANGGNGTNDSNTNMQQTSWGARQGNGEPPKNQVDDVEAAFLAKNPGLKI